MGLLYHLTKEGWKDVVLVEKGELTSGSTWHAAGLIPHFIGSLSMAKIHYYGSELYKKLEAETGQATGWHGCGAVGHQSRPSRLVSLCQRCSRSNRCGMSFAGAG